MDEIVVVGGLVPSLLIDQEHLAENVSAHVGTLDLDLGLAFALVGEERYQEVAERLRHAGFRPDENETGQPSRQRWRISDPPVAVDFLIEPDDPEAKPGNLFSLARDWAAMITPGLHLAFEDSQTVTLEGFTIAGEKARRALRVCGAGAYVVLKALAFHNRGENKDAYDLFYLLRNYGHGVEDVAARLQPLLKDECAQRALAHLREDFLDPEGVGSRRVADFLYARPDPEIQADTAGFVRSLLYACGT